MSLRSRWREAKARRGLDREIEALQRRIDRLVPGAADRCLLLNDLGNRLRARYESRGSRHDLDIALDCYREALSAPCEPAKRNVIEGNFAVALLDRFHAGDDLADLEASITLTREAVAGAKAGSSDRALHLINLANALNERYARTRQRADLAEAIESGEEALELSSEDPRLGAAASLNLAVALGARNAQMDAPRAADLLRRTVANSSPGSQAHELALVGIAVVTGALGDPGALGLDVDDATMAAVAEVAGSAPVGSPRRSVALHALGRARWARYKRTKDRADLDASIAALQDAVDGARSDADLMPRYLNDLGRVLTELSVTSDSAQGLARAVEVWTRAQSLLNARFDSVETSYQLGQRTLSMELGLAERIVSVYLQLAERAVTSEGRDWMLRNAVWAAEETKSRMLTGLIGRGDLPEPADVPPAVVAREHEIVEQLRHIDIDALAIRDLGAADVDHAELRRTLRRELERLWMQIESTSEHGYDYVALRRGQPLTWDTIAELAARLGPQTALASMFVTNARALLFIVRDDADSPRVEQIEIDRKGWLDLMDRFDREVRRGVGMGSETWDDRLQPLLRRALPHVAGAERVVLAPVGLGLQLPWATVARRAGWRTADGRSMPIITIESIALLSRLLARDRVDAHSGAVVVGNPTGDLVHAEAEARQIAAMLGVEALIGPSATKADVIARLRTASIAHIAGHASLVSGAPLDSAIALADGHLTAREIMAERIQLDMIVLSACETGAAETLGGYEYAGLSQSFLLAGARSVIASLWKVDDPATAGLMEHFYASWLAGSDLAQALSTAMEETDLDAAGEGGGRKWDMKVENQPVGSLPDTYYRDPFVISGTWSIAPAE